MNCILNNNKIKNKIKKTINEIKTQKKLNFQE